MPHATARASAQLTAHSSLLSLFSSVFTFKSRTIFSVLRVDVAQSFGDGADHPSKFFEVYGCFSPEHCDELLVSFSCAAAQVRYYLFHHLFFRERGLSAEVKVELLTIVYPLLKPRVR